jgi:uncharacterized protein YgiB involved in biofilm formation
MRRSEWVAILGFGGAYLLMLHMLGEKDPPLDIPPEVAVFPAVEACIQTGKPEAVCNVAFRTAVKAHYSQAPHFDQRQACEQAHGGNGCDLIPAAAGRSEYFVPMMAGFVLGSALGLDAAVPVYYDRQGYARVAGGDYRLGKPCDDKDGRCGGGGGGGGSGGNLFHGSEAGKSKPQIVNTSSGNLRSVSRGGFGLSLHGAGG